MHEYSNYPQPMSLREVFGILRRQRLSILILTVVCILGGFLQVSRSTPVFQSQAKILVEGPGSRAQNDPVSTVTSPVIQWDIGTQIEFLQSATFLEKAFSAAGIDIQELLQEPNGGGLVPILRVEPAQQASVLTIITESGDPELAMRLAQSAPAVYLGEVMKFRQQEVNKSIDFLQKRLTDERMELDKAEAELLAFKKARPLLPLVGEGSVRSGNAAGAQAEIAQLDARVAAEEERIRQLERTKSELPKKLRTPTSVSNAQMIENQKAKISELKGQRNALLTRVLPDHRDVIELDQQIKDAEKRLSEIPKEMDASDETRHPELLAYESKIADARANLKALYTQRAELRGWQRRTESDLRSYSAIAPEQDKLERAVEERKKTITDTIAAIEEHTVRRNSFRDAVTVLTPAGMGVQIRPKPEQTILLALLFGLFLGVGFGFLKDTIDDRVATPEEISRLTGLPTLGEVYPLPRRRGQNPSIATLNGRYLERYRVLRFNFDLATMEHPVGSILVTSSGRGEGKTEVACNLALSLARGGGKRVILANADFRWPSVHKMLPVKAGPGLGEVVAGESNLEEALQPGPVPELQILASTEERSNPVDLLAQPEMRELSKKLGELSDLVIFDVPGAIGLADAHILSRSVDSVLYVAKVGKTKRSALKKGIENLQMAGVHVIGVVAVAEKSKV